MSHEHSVKTVASQIKSVTNSGTAKMIDSAMGNRSLGSMMSNGIRSMLKTPGVSPGIVASSGISAGIKAIRKIFTHPLVLFSLGVVVGCYVCKNRKAIISASSDVQLPK